VLLHQTDDALISLKRSQVALPIRLGFVRRVDIQALTTKLIETPVSVGVALVCELEKLL
jgi:hypothetical protein